MAWFKLNDSLASLKDQLSNVSHVVQEAFQENPEDEDEHQHQHQQQASGSGGGGGRLNALQSCNDELSSLCGSQAHEIAALRRQIQDLQLANGPATTTAAATAAESGASGSGGQQQQQQPAKLAASNNNATPTTAGNSLEDSWFWESEPGTTATTTGSTASSASASDHHRRDDLKTVPLDGTGQSAELAELAEQFKRARIENAILNEKVAQLQEEVRQGAVNLERLDGEHGVAIDEVLHIKDGLQRKCGGLEREVEDLLRRLGLQKTAEQEEIGHLRAELAESRAETKVKHAELEDHVREWNKMLASIKELQADLDRLGEEKEAGEAQLQQELERHREQARKDAQRIEELLDAVRELESDVPALLPQSADLTELQAELERLRAEKAAGETEWQEVVGRTASKAEDDARFIASLKESVQQLESEKCREVGKLQLELEQLYEQKRVDDNTFSDIKKAEAQAEKDAKLIASLQESVRQLESANPPRQSPDFDALQSELNRISEEKLAAETQLQQEIERNAAQSKHDALLIESLQEANRKLKGDRPAHPPQTTDLDEVGESAGEVIDSLDTNAAIPLSQLVALLQPYSPIDASDSTGVPLLVRLRDTLATIDQLKFDLESLAEKNHQLSETNSHVQHAKDTAQADLHHYEVELAEVMKNNELLLAELDAFKASGKLETISEQNEDNIIHLEQQLEDCSNLNQSLEDEYQAMRDRLEAADLRVQRAEEDLAEHQEALQTARKELIEELDRRELMESELKRLKESLQTVRDEADQERSTWAFELAEIKATERPAEVVDELRARVLCADAEKQQLQTQLAEARQTQHSAQQELTATIDAHLAQIAEQQELIAKKSSDVQELVAEMQTARAAHSAEIAQLTAQLQAAQDHSSQDSELQQALASAVAEKAELVALITAKHSESVQYHEEITRLSALLLAEQRRECSACSATAAQLVELRRNTEAATEQATLLRDGADSLTASLRAEQAAHQRAVALTEQLQKERADQLAEAQRLRSHLLQVEEAHTQEQMEMQQQLEQAQVQLAGLEQEARKSSTAYTSASIRANQHTETLQAQYHLLVQQRDEFSAKLSAAEDKESRSEAALINLQCALEQFQNNKERDILERTQQMQRQLDASAAAQDQLRADLLAVQQQVQDSKNGLLAAARITDQLESAQMANTNLRDELHLLRDQHTSLQQQMAAVQATHSDKVEKNLLKNLLIGYVAAPNAADKQQVLKLVASVLEFDAHEEERVGLGRAAGGQMGWLGAIRNAALVVGQSTAVGPDSYNKEGIAQAFVRFLENESKPRQPSTAPSLLNIVPQTPAPTPAPSRRSTPPSGPAASSISSQAADGQLSAAQDSAATAAAAAATPLATAAPVQPILIGDGGLLQSFAPARNTSTILKDILSDS